MKKKTRKLFKKNLLQAKRAFSLVELVVSMIVIAVIIAALAPTISKRLSSGNIVKNRISTNCDSFYPDGYCAMCYINPKSCISCTRSCAENQYKNVGKCICENCSSKYNDSHCDRCNSHFCTRCEEGYYLLNHKCIPCPVGHYCNHTLSATKAQPCAVGTAQPKTAQTSCIDCVMSDETQTGNYANTTGMANCINCPSGNYAKSAVSTACDICPAGYYCPSGKIIPCPKGTANAKTGQYRDVSCISCIKSTVTMTGTVAPNSAMSACDICGNGNYAEVQGQQTNCSVCPAGYYCPSGKLIPCPKGTANGKTGQTACIDCNKSTSILQGNVATSTGQTSCTGCSAGTYAAIDKQYYACKICTAGSACPNGQLVECTAGYYSPSGASSCIPCPAGSNSSKGASSCYKCADGCTSCNGGGCTSCKAGYELLNDGPRGYRCFKCEEGTYSTGGSTYCKECPKGQTSSVGASSCVKCAAGCAECEGAANNCTSCLPGYYRSGSSCIYCPAGYYCKGEMWDKIACENGSNSNAGASNASQCTTLWDCSKFGGTVKDNLCYKQTALGACNGTNEGHTWAPASSYQVGIIQKSSLVSVQYSYTAAYTDRYNYHPGVTVVESCKILQPMLGQESCFNSGDGKRICSPKVSESTSYYLPRCAAEKVLCVTYNL